MEIVTAKKIIAVFLSMTFLAVMSWYYIQATERGFYCAKLASLVDGYAAMYKRHKDRVGDADLVKGFREINSLALKIQGLTGYDKYQHKTYHYLARGYLATGRVSDAVEMLKKSIAFHPYYANAFKMLGNILSNIGMKDKAKACHKVSEDIFGGSKPGIALTNKCLGDF